MPNLKQTYLHNATYDALLAALLKAADHPTDRPSALSEALGEIGGVWPVSVRDDQHFVEMGD